MRLPSLLRLRVGGRPSIGRIAAGVVELWLIALAVQILEFVGRVATDDAADVVGVLLFLLVGGLVAAAARAGRAPVTAFVLGGAFRRARQALRRLEPAAGVAFRLPASPGPLPWTPRREVLLIFGALVVMATAGGAWLYEGLVFLRLHVAYTAYLVGIVLLWGLFGLVTALGLFAVRTLARVDRAKTPLERALRWVPWLVLWVGVIVALAAVPGWIGLLATVLLALVSGRAVWRRAVRPYWLWRQDPEGRIRSATVLGWLRATWAASALFLLFTVLLAQLPRLAYASPPVGRFGITVGLGLAATAASLVLLLHAGAYLARTLPPRGRAPEAPLVRTLWWPGGGEAPWRGAAEAEGWTIATGARPPAGGYDLAIGVAGDGRGVEIPEAFSVDDALFRLQRRFHVVKRRAFFRRLRVLHKAITKPPRVAGAGYLFCPAAWPVPAVIRDGARGGEDGRAVLGGRQVGPPYAEVFPLRVRRYLAEVLGALEIDLVYWEDRVGWAPLRAVLGVLFETYDQERFPLEERHLAGLLKVRALIQEPEDLDAILQDPLRDPSEGPPPLRARVLVLRRDDGGQREKSPARQPGDRMPVGSAS